MYQVDIIQGGYDHMAGETKGRGFVHESGHKGETNEWYTPVSIFAGLGQEYCDTDSGPEPVGGPLFDMDVASPGYDATGRLMTHVPAARHLTVADDGLATQWEGLVWCNPPYGPETKVWLGKCADYGSSGGSAVALVFSRTDTKWFQDAAASCDRLLFLSGRVKFHKEHKDSVNNGAPGVGSVLFAWGSEAAALLDASQLAGFMVSNPSRHGVTMEEEDTLF